MAPVGDSPLEMGFFGSLFQVYSFSDGRDQALMIIGLICALIQATIPPLIMGNFITLSIELEEFSIQNMSDSSNFYQKYESDSSKAFIVMVSLSFIMLIVAFIQRISWEISAIRQVFHLKIAYVRKLLNMDTAWLDSRLKAGQLTVMLHKNTDTIFDGISDNFPMFIFITAYLLVNIAVCFWIQWDVTLLFCSFIPLVVVGRLLFSKWLASRLVEEASLQSKISNVVNETISCIRTVISFAAQKTTLQRFEDLSTENQNKVSYRLKISTVFDCLTQILITELIFTFALCYGIWRIGYTNAGALCAVCILDYCNFFQLAINILYMCVTSISIGVHLNGIGLARARRAEMESVFSANPTIESSSKLDENSWKKIVEENEGNILEFKDVRFCYPNRPNVEVLKGINLTIKAGEKLAICGASGSGKSTIAALILRVYDPSHGNIEFYEQTLSELNPNKVREQFAIVSQEPVLFNGTIEENIRYGNLNATRVTAWEFISRLPEGLETRVGYRGLQLSGGQKQRIAIARAVLRKPRLLIFDEATSALDNIHEEEVAQAINLASKGLTTISIAHKLTTVRNADRIIVLDQGQILEEGAPDVLLANKDSQFSKLCLMQGVKKEPKGLKEPKGDYENVSLSEKEARNNTEPIYKSSFRHKDSHDENELTPLNRKKSKQNQWKPRFDSLKEAKGSKWSGFISLIRTFRSGYYLLACGIPTTMIRAVFYLLICFEVASMLEISIVPQEQRLQRTLIVGLVYAGLIVIKTIFETLGRLFLSLYGHGLARNVQKQMLSSILRQNCSYFDEEENSPGKLIYKVINDTETLNKAMTYKLDMLIPAIVCSIFAIIAALLINWKLAILCSFQFPVYFFIQIIQLREGAKRMRRLKEDEATTSALINDMLNNMTTIKAYNLQKHFGQVFEKHFKDATSNMKSQSLASAIAFAGHHCFIYVLIAITLYFGKIMMQNGEVTIFDYMRVVLLTTFGANFFSQLITSVIDLSRAHVSADSVLEVIQRKPEFDNFLEIGKQPKIQGKITFENVWMNYPTRPGIAVLKGININIKPGEMIGIAGDSGSGKSTILQILQGLYTKFNGETTIDDIPIGQLDQNYLRRNIVAVTQEPSLFSFTIRENIAYGLQSQEYWMEEVQSAAKIANIHDFILTLPERYETDVGEFGSQLSAGQKQRIAIARALIRRPKVLLFDEATAALDSSTETAVLDSVLAERGDTTIIYVSHRLSTIKRMDRIYYISDGTVLETGAHNELMSQQGLYYNMFK